MTVKERLAALAAEVEVYLRERFGARMRERGGQVAADGECRRQRRVRQIARIAAFALHRGGLRRVARPQLRGLAQAGARRQRRSPRPGTEYRQVHGWGALPFSWRW